MMKEYVIIVCDFRTFMLGANYVVQVGEKIQIKSGASSGDAVIIRGTFPEQAVTITQPMRLVRRKGRMSQSGARLPWMGYRETSCCVTSQSM